MYFNRGNDYTLKNVEAEEQKLSYQEHAKLVAEQRNRADKRRANYNKFLTESKEFLVSEAMNEMLLQCLPNNLDPQLKVVGKHCCENFVKEEGVNNILRNCKKTLFLNEFAIILEETHKKVVLGAADNKNDEFEIDNSTMKEYYDKLRGMNYEPMCKTIIDRVADAEKDFVQSNIKDREQIESAAEKAKDKIDSIRTKDEDTAEDIKEEFTIMYKKEVNNIENRRRNILESIIRHMGKNIVSDDVSRNDFIQESGKLNMNRIIDTSEVMYTFLEMVNTTQLREVNAEYLEGVLKSIK